MNEIELAILDSFHLRIILDNKKKLEDPNISDFQREMCEMLIKSSEEELELDRESVEDPFMPGHRTIVTFKRGTQRPLTLEEERFNALSPEEQEKIRERNKKSKK